MNRPPHSQTVRPARITALLALCALPLLGGCIAAAALVPIVAGGGLAASRVDGLKNSERKDVDRADAAATRPPFDRGDSAPPAGLEQASGGRPAPTGSGPAASAAPVPAVPAELAARPAAASAPFGSESMIDAPAYGGLFAYAMAASARPKAGQRRQSALLISPGALKPETSRCNISQPAILIDLDPGDDLLDASARFAPNPPLAGALAALRERDVSVHWISGNSAAEAGAIRKRLAEAGLDPDGRDELVLMRYPDDRKQGRRDAVGATHCLIAIAGEERRDFDELYTYLKDPGSAGSLEKLVGNGWFLVPPALQAKE